MTAIATAALVDRIAALDRPLLVALDVDGTLAPIVRNPDLAAIPTPTLAVLEGLSVTEGVVLALITVATSSPSSVSNASRASGAPSNTVV